MQNSQKWRTDVYIFFAIMHQILVCRMQRLVQREQSLTELCLAQQV